MSRRPVQKIAELASHSWRFPSIALTLSGWTGSPLRLATQFAISHHELITECIFVASYINYKRCLALTGCGCHCATLFLQGNGVFAVDTVPARAFVQRLPNLSGFLVFSRHTEYDEVVSASHSWHACTKSV